MFRYQKGKVRVMGLLCRILVAVAIYRYDAVGILIYHSSLGIHTEGAHVILVFFRAIHDLALIEFIRKIRKDLSRQLNPDPQIHAVGIRMDIQILAYLLHPLTAASSGGNDTFRTLKGCIIAVNLVTFLRFLHGFDGTVKIEIHLILQMIIEVLQNNIINIRTQMADRSIQKMQAVLHTGFLKFCSRSGIQLRALPAKTEIDSIHIFHQFNGCLFSDILIESAAEIIGNVVFSIRKCTGSAESTHDGAAFAVNTGLDFITINGTFTVLQRMSYLKNSDL